MEIKLLKTFQAVAKTQSFSGASKTLGYAQPTVTTHIQLLERELNTRLFERLGHTIKLTEGGERLLYYSENIIKYSEEAIADLSEKGRVSGKITIGANESFSVARLPDIFKHFISRYPKMELILTQKNCTFRAMIDDILRQNQVHPRTIIEINNIEAIKQLVESGLGVTIMPHISVVGEIKEGRLAKIDLRGPDLPVCTQIAYHKDKWLSPTILTFVQETRDLMRRSI